MHQEGSELRRSHKQNEVGGLPLPLLQPNIFIGLEKNTAQFKHSYQHLIVTAHYKHSRSAFSQARSTLQETDNAVWPYQYANIT